MTDHPYPWPAGRLLAVAAGALLTAACAGLGPGDAPARAEPEGFVARMADGAYDIGIRYPSRRTRYVMNVEDEGEVLTVTMRPAAAVAAGVRDPAAIPADIQQVDRVVEPCGPEAGNWYRHTPVGYVCVAQVTPVAGIAGPAR